jgi:putative tryptophan/tyrosine transport system substrate-binding protein
MPFPPGLGGHMQRRQFIAFLGGAAAAWPIGPRAQQPERTRRIGIFPAYDQSDREAQVRIAAFLDTFRKLGWAEGRNVTIEYRWGADIERVKVAAVELVHMAPDAILASAPTTVAELQRLASMIPVVFVQVSDPVGAGFVADLARPGGNVTGFENFQPAMGGKWLGVLKEAIPNLTRVALLLGSDSESNIAFLHAAQTVASSLGVAVSAIDTYGEIEGAIAAFAGQPNGGLIIAPHPNTVTNRGYILTLAARHRLPAIYPFRYFAAEGGLISYGPDQLDQWRGAATYVDRILRGEKPGDLPVQAPTKFELVVNLKTAKALGLSIPAAFPLRADEVIE